jgi:hypothetical protein
VITEKPMQVGVIFDDQGNEWGFRSIELRRRLYCLKYQGNFEADMVRNLGFISIVVMGSTSVISLNSDNAAPAAIGACCYWISDKPQKRVLIQFVGENNKSILTHSKSEAVRHISRETARRLLGRRLIASDVSPTMLEPRSPAWMLLDRWSEMGTETPVAVLLPLVEELMAARYFMVKRTEIHDLVFDVVGSGLQVPDKDWHKSAVGRTVESQPDKECWEWAARNHHSVLDVGAPKVTDITAEIYWPESGWVQRSYRRLLMPCISADGMAGVLSTNCARVADINSVAA